MLYEVAILTKPTKKERDDDGAQEELVLGPVYITAPDQQKAAFKVLRSDAAKDVNVDRSEILVRPFA